MSGVRRGRTLYTGVGVGGPADGIELVSRFPKGLLVVDRPAGLVHIYDFEAVMSGELGRFVVREEAGRGEDVERRFSAALGSEYDVISVGAVIS
jgi:hypothetical protein